ncbi:MAG TPA: class II glutamine amidotransferase [Thermoanaerobaculia bacterium]|nr:class II glutamine amidotransferase [Thermoanaerobaculia bacterium]
MCRFVAYLGPPVLLSSLTTDPANSIIHQSFHSHEREEPLNGDGFGLAWYVPETRREAALFRSVSPAWSNMNLLHLARVTRSGCIFAHVRAATPGLPVTETNTHPFSWGELAFMHNGELGCFQAIRRRLLDGLSEPAFDLIQGTTDSEHLFAAIVDRLLRAGRDSTGSPVEALGEALSGAVEDALELGREMGAEEPSYLNLALTDGRRLAACRFTDGELADSPSLYVHQGQAFTCEDGRCRFFEPDDRGHAVLVASEPLTDDPEWSVVEPNTLLLVTEDRAVTRRPMASGA